MPTLATAEIDATACKFPPVTAYSEPDRLPICDGIEARELPDTELPLVKSCVRFPAVAAYPLICRAAFGPPTNGRIAPSTAGTVFASAAKVGDDVIAFRVAAGVENADACAAVGVTGATCPTVTGVAESGVAVAGALEMATRTS